MTLTLTLKKKWFDMIFSGEKKEEYRTIKKHWKSRLEGKSYDKILFINGYHPDSPRFEIECLGISIATGKKEWGAEDAVEYYVIKLGKIL